MKRSVGLATEEMMPCPSCDTLTFEIGDCFACSSKKGDGSGPWTADEITRMTEFARGFIKASMQHRNGLWIDLRVLNLEQTKRDWATLCTIVREFRDEFMNDPVMSFCGLLVAAMIGAILAGLWLAE